MISIFFDILNNFYDLNEFYKILINSYDICSNFSHISTIVCYATLNNISFNFAVIIFEPILHPFQRLYYNLQ